MYIHVLCSVAGVILCCVANVTGIVKDRSNRMTATATYYESAFIPELQVVVGS